MQNVEILEEIGLEPVTLEEVKAYCRVDSDYTGDDALLSELIKSARTHIENWANISLVSKRIRVYSDDKGVLYLPFAPVKEIDSVTDKKGVAVEYDDTLPFEVEVFHSRGYFITYVTGYKLLPQDLKTAVLKQVATDYDNRENFIINGNTQQLTAVELTNSAKNLVAPYNRTLLWL